jgi:WD40 repeat protein
MRGGTLVTGGSDGSVRVWSLERFCAIHRLAAHDNSVTSLQFDDTRVVSGGSDGRVKVWDLKTGNLVRELVTQGEAVWRVAFEEEKCVAMALKNSRTVMEVSGQQLHFAPSTAVANLNTRCGHSPLRKKCSSTSNPCYPRSGGSRDRYQTGRSAHSPWVTKDLDPQAGYKMWI